LFACDPFAEHAQPHCEPFAANDDLSVRQGMAPILGIPPTNVNPPPCRAIAFSEKIHFLGKKTRVF